MIDENFKTTYESSFSMNYDDVCLTLGNYPYSSRFEDDKIIFGGDVKNSNSVESNMNVNKVFKYNEEEIVKELLEYIRGTYKQHYSSGDDEIQTLDLIGACGDGEPFCRSNILKYASRYDKKGTARLDIMKVMHYAVLLMHFNDKNSQREIYPQ